MVALLIGCGVLTGMAALVVDVGQLYQERAELQNGADAAAIGVAKSCALGTCASEQSLSNSRRQRLQPHRRSGGSRPGLRFRQPWELARPAPGRITDCPAAPPAGTNFVDVHTSTQDGQRLHAASAGFRRHAAWQPAIRGPPCTPVRRPNGARPRPQRPLPSRSRPASGTRRRSREPYSRLRRRTRRVRCPRQSFDQVLTLNPGNGTGCATEPAGADGPGTFGWAADQLGNCTLPVSGPTFPGSTTTSVSRPAKPSSDYAQDNESRSWSLSTCR